MRLKQLLTPLFIAILTIFILAACGSSLEKPTGIEESDDEQIEKIKDNEAKANDSDKKTQKDKKNDETDEKVKDQDEKNNTNKTEEVDDRKETKITKHETGSNDSNTTKNSSSSNETNSNKDKKETKKNSNSNQTESSNSKTSNSNSSNSNSSNSKSSNESTNNTTTKTPEQKEEKPQKTTNTVTQSIVISSSEVPLSATETEINDGDTVLDVLIKITKEKGIQMDYKGGGSSAYIEGIANVYEFDRGQGSGWMYRINGVFPDRGAGAIQVQNGDVIEWLYTTDLGKDLGADLKPFRR